MQSRINTVKTIEHSVGKFSQYQFDGGIAPGPHIFPENRLAYQFLSQLNCHLKENQTTKDIITETNSGHALNRAGNRDLLIYYRGPNNGTPLIIPGARIDSFLQKSCVYVNTDLLPITHYKACLNKPADQRLKATGNPHIDSYAAAICHAQPIDLLISQKVVNGMAISAEKNGTVRQDSPAILLLSMPAIDFSMDYSKTHSNKAVLDAKGDEAKKIITGMYRNLFKTAFLNGYKYIALPAAGLGAYRGDPETYFNCLMNVAKEEEFNELCIIYNPLNKRTQFDQCFAQKQPTNIIVTDKDVTFFADGLTQAGLPCALHNPSDPEVVFGCVSIGKNVWRPGSAAYAGEEHFGATTTALINSYHLNPVAFENAKENTFSQQLTPANNNANPSTLVVYAPQNVNQPSQNMNPQPQFAYPQAQNMWQSSQNAIPYATGAYQNQIVAQQKVFQASNIPTNVDPYHAQQATQTQIPVQNWQGSVVYEKIVMTTSPSGQSVQPPMQTHYQYQYQYSAQTQMSAYNQQWQQPPVHTQQLYGQPSLHQPSYGQPSYYQGQPHPLPQYQQPASGRFSSFPRTHLWEELRNCPTNIEAGISRQLGYKLSQVLGLNYFPYLEKKADGFYFGFKDPQDRAAVISMISNYFKNADLAKNWMNVGPEEALMGNITWTKEWEKSRNPASGSLTFFAPQPEYYNFGFFIPTSTLEETNNLINLFSAAFPKEMNMAQLYHYNMPSRGIFGVHHKQVDLQATMPRY